MWVHVFVLCATYFLVLSYVIGIISFGIERFFDPDGTNSLRDPLLQGLSDSEFDRINERSLNSGDFRLDNEDSIYIHCTICFLQYEKKEHVKVMPSCGHSFHSDCIREWLKRSTKCPNCNRDLQHEVRRHHHEDIAYNNE